MKRIQTSRKKGVRQTRNEALTVFALGGVGGDAHVGLCGSDCSPATAKRRPALSPISLRMRYKTQVKATVLTLRYKPAGLWRNRCLCNVAISAQRMSMRAERRLQDPDHDGTRRETLCVMISHY